MEEREAASYQLQAAISGFSEEDYDYGRLPDQTPDDDNINSQLGWTYADYMKAAGLDPGDSKHTLMLVNFSVFCTRHSK